MSLRKVDQAFASAALELAIAGCRGGHTSLLTASYERRVDSGKSVIRVALEPHDEVAEIGTHGGMDDFMAAMGQVHSWSEGDVTLFEHRASY
jgi:hypothetical protein